MTSRWGRLTAAHLLSFVAALLNGSRLRRSLPIPKTNLSLFEFSNFWAENWDVGATKNENQLKWFMYLLANKNNNIIKQKSLGCGTDEIGRLFPFWSALDLFWFIWSAEARLVRLDPFDLHKPESSAQAQSVCLGLIFLFGLLLRYLPCLVCLGAFHLLKPNFLLV